MYEINSFNFYGLKVSSFSYEELVDYIKISIRNNNKILCYGYSLGIIPYMKRYPVIYELGEQSDLLVTDGTPYYLMLKWLKFPVKYEISIPNLVRLLIKIASEENYSLMLLGSTKDSNKKAITNVKSENLGIKKISGIDGYFNSNEEIDIVKQINESESNILLVGMSSPKKENFILKYRTELKTNIIVPCGGMIEVLAGNVKQTPKAVKALGLASFYRLMQEPRRLMKRYLYLYFFLFFRFIPTFFWKVIVLRKKDFSIPKQWGIS